MISYTHWTYHSSNCFGYEYKWWTIHLTQCSPDDNVIFEIVKRMDPRLTDIDGSERVIDWLKVLILFHGSYYPNLTGSAQRVPCTPEALISHWEDHRQALLDLSQRACSSSLYPCVQGWAAEEGIYSIFLDPKTYLKITFVVQNIGRKIHYSFIKLCNQNLMSRYRMEHGE